MLVSGRASTALSELKGPHGSMFRTCRWRKFPAEAPKSLMFARELVVYGRFLKGGSLCRNCRRISVSQKRDPSFGTFVSCRKNCGCVSINSFGRGVALGFRLTGFCVGSESLTAPEATAQSPSVYYPANDTSAESCGAGRELVESKRALRPNPKAAKEAPDRVQPLVRVYYGGFYASPKLPLCLQSFASDRLHRHTPSGSSPTAHVMNTATSVLGALMFCRYSFAPQPAVIPTTSLRQLSRRTFCHGAIFVRGGKSMTLGESDCCMFAVAWHHAWCQQPATEPYL